MLSIVKYPNKILRLRSKKLTVNEILKPENQRFFKELAETMIKEDGIGLASNQVDRDIRVLAVAYENGPKVFINPVIYWRSFGKEVAEEGCLSFPNVFGQVKRAKKIRLIFRDEKGKLKHLKASGLLARVLLHETDHLNGVLFIDKIIKYTKNGAKIEEWQKSADVNSI